MRWNLSIAAPQSEALHRSPSRPDNSGLFTSDGNPNIGPSLPPADQPDRQAYSAAPPSRRHRAHRSPASASLLQQLRIDPELLRPRHTRSPFSQTTTRCRCGHTTTYRFPDTRTRIVRIMLLHRLETIARLKILVLVNATVHPDEMQFGQNAEPFSSFSSFFLRARILCFRALSFFDYSSNLNHWLAPPP